MTEKPIIGGGGGGAGGKGCKNSSGSEHNSYPGSLQAHDSPPHHTGGEAVASSLSEDSFDSLQSICSDYNEQVSFSLTMCVVYKHAYTHTQAERERERTYHII